MFAMRLKHWVRGSVALLAVVVASHLVSAPASARFSFNIDVGSGPPGTVITVTGSGYNQGTPVYTYLRQGAHVLDQQEGAASSQGRITHHLTVPAGTPAGSYLVTIIPVFQGQDINSLFQSAVSSNLGMPFGVTAGGSGPSNPPSPPPAAVPYGGNCHGAGCEHPDLRAYGGNGPASSGTSISLHRSHNGYNHFVSQLSASTSVASLAQQCNRQGGQFTLLDDEPWYYYYSGYYATFGC